MYKNKMKPANPNAHTYDEEPRNKILREEEGSAKCGVESGKCGVLSVECGVWSGRCKVWSVKCGV